MNPPFIIKSSFHCFKNYVREGLTCYLDSSGFFEFEAIRPLINVTDKFLFDLKGEGLGLQSLCFDRQNRQGIVPKNIIPTHQQYQARNLDAIEELGAIITIE